MNQYYFKVICSFLLLLVIFAPIFGQNGIVVKGRVLEEKKWRPFNWSQYQHKGQTNWNHHRYGWKF